MDGINSYVNLSNNDLSLVLHCRLRDFYAYKKACEIAIEYLYANNYKGLIEISLDKSRDSLSKLITLANIRMIKPDVTEDMVDVNVDKVIFVLREIKCNYISRIRMLGHDLYSDTPVLEREVEINNYFDELINNLKEKEEELILKREKISKWSLFSFN